MRVRLHPSSAAVLIAAATLIAATGTATAAGAPPGSGTKTTIVGGLGTCTKQTGALVAVSFSHWSGPVVRGCDPHPTTGIKLLTTAKFTTVGTQHDGPAFLCRIGHPRFHSGTQYPTPAQDACVNTPPASAYWSYWLAPKGKNTWTYSPLGAYSDHPKDGEVEAWRYGGTDVGGTSGQPTFTPNQVRAGLPNGTARHSYTTDVASAPRTADLAKAVHYLTAQLVDGTHYEPFGGGFADFGLTMDGAYALAAAGTADPNLTRIVDFLDDLGKDGTGRTVNDYTDIGTRYALGGAIGKEALTAEIAGHDPRSFGGHDLIAALDKLVCTTTITNFCAAPGNYRNTPSTFGQALGILAQLRAGDASGATKPAAFLEAQQHDSGAFASVFDPGTDSETDSTGMAAMALALVDTDAARSAVAKALAWLAAQQTGDGGFPGASGDSVNSAAISVQALDLTPDTYATQIAKAERFLASAQNSDGGFDVAADADGSDVRASTQATGAVVGTPFGSVLDDLTAKQAAVRGGAYLITQLKAGNHFVNTYQGKQYPDQGLTSDGVFALLATGGHPKAVSAMTTWLSGQVDVYADPTGAAGGPYSGGLAKLALVAESVGKDPHSFGGTDLLGVLRAHVCRAATSDGSCTAAGDFVSGFSSISQSLGVLALQASTRAADHLTASSKPVVRLGQLQCADGGFTSELLAPGADCTSDVDATGYAVQALAAVPGTDARLAAAQHYLQQVQLASGLFHGTAGDNSNSTALASDALQVLTRAGQVATSATAARVVAPVYAWQQALHGLVSLSVPGGGFGLTGNQSADLRASTQAVEATAQRDLLSLSGAAVRSAPRAGTVPPPTSPPPTSAPPSSSAPGGPGSGSSDGPPLADTGAAAGPQLGWALALLLAGCAFAYAGRRRVRARHR